MESSLILITEKNVYFFWTWTVLWSITYFFFVAHTSINAKCIGFELAVLKVTGPWFQRHFTAVLCPPPHPRNRNIAARRAQYRHFTCSVNIQIYGFPTVLMKFFLQTNINCALFCCECICRPGPRLCRPRRVPKSPVNHRGGSLVSSRRRMPRIRPPDRRRYLGVAAAP